MRERLAEIKLNRKNIALKEMEDDMNLALRNIDDFVEAQKGTS